MGGGETPQKTGFGILRNTDTEHGGFTEQDVLVNGTLSSLVSVTDTFFLSKVTLFHSGFGAEVPLSFQEALKDAERGLFSRKQNTVEICFGFFGAPFLDFCRRFEPRKSSSTP